MHSRLLTFKQLRPGLMALLAILMVAVLPATSVRGQVTGPESDAGMICVLPASSDSTTDTFNLTATDGYISIPDGNTIYMWGFALAANEFQHPGPNLCVTEGRIVTINLTNTLGEPVSMIFPGQSGVTAVMTTGSGVTANSLALAAAPGATVQYAFTAARPGSYLYESGTDLEKQVQMGLFGSLVVRPALQSGSNWFVYNDAATQFNPNDEYMMLLSEIDPDLHAAVELGETFDFSTYHPRYWLINGRAFPDTIAPNFANWLPTQPYGALLHIFPTSAGSHPAAMRFLNVGTRQHPIHPHGDHVRIIGRDGGLLAQAYEKFDVNIGPGQTWDALYDWTNLDNYTPGNPLPADATALDEFGTWLNPRNQNQLFKEPNFYSGSPYLGYQGNKDDAAVTSYNECGEYYQIWHSHALNEAANYEAGFGGMITLERIDPPLPNTCSTLP